MYTTTVSTTTIDKEWEIFEAIARRKELFFDSALQLFHN